MASVSLRNGFPHLPLLGKHSGIDHLQDLFSVCENQVCFFLGVVLPLREGDSSGPCPATTAKVSLCHMRCMSYTSPAA